MNLGFTEDHRSPAFDIYGNRISFNVIIWLTIFNWWVCLCSQTGLDGWTGLSVSYWTGWKSATRWSLCSKSAMHQCN